MVAVPIVLPIADSVLLIFLREKDSDPWDEDDTEGDQFDRLCELQYADENGYVQQE